MKCPKCGSKRVVTIIYGITEYDEELKRQIMKEEIYLSRSSTKINPPQYHCFGCGKNVGSLPILNSKYGRED